MEITLEMVERLREKASVSYAEAKQALEYSEGNLLDALIYLEEKGNIPRTENAYFSTKDQPAPPPPPQEPPDPEPPVQKGVAGLVDAGDIHALPGEVYLGTAVPGIVPVGGNGNLVHPLAGIAGGVDVHQVLSSDIQALLGNRKALAA